VLAVLSSSGLRGLAITVVAATVAAAALLAEPPAASARSRAANSPRLTVSPQPGTLDASPETQISILGAASRKIQSVRVTGSLSGVHAGALRAYSANRGASFVLSKPLTQGEWVAVQVRVAGRRPIAFSFTVARLAPTPPVINIPTTQPAKLQHFVTQPQLIPPRVSVDKTSSSLAEDLFLTPLPSPIVHPGSNNAISITPVGPGGPMIIDPHGRLVWFHQLPNPTVATNFRPQLLDGRTVLTWWQGEVTIAAYGLGEGMIYSTSYRPIRTVRAGNGYSADLHEFVLTPSGDALLTVQSLILTHRAGTARGTLSPFLDSIVQEVDIHTGLVVWEWHALGHIPLADSYATAANSPYFDAYHINSIGQVHGDRLLISARDTSAIYEIDRATGRIVWTLGGKASSFRMERGTRFYFQHDARLLRGDRVSLFDDEGGPPFEARSSRGLILELDLRRRTARLVHQYRRPGNDTLADSEGSLQTVAGGAELVGFGSERYFSEFAPGGRLLFDASLPVDDGSYRVFSAPWMATPTSRPSVTAERISPARVLVYASWNGATTVARWQLLAARAGARLRPVASAPDRGFETQIAVTGPATRFEVRALGSSGRVLSRSNPASVS
jgi:Arylsulfotransferase (ASST)